MTHRASVFDALTAATPGSGITDYEVGEFRLICSGSLYSGRVLTADWTKSDASRLILPEPLLWVVSQPADAYPQELMLRIRVPRITTQAAERFSFTEYPHAEVARDAAALLTLLLRRLITLHSHVRIAPATGMPAGYPPEGLPWPIAGASVSAWPRRPSAVIRSVEGIEIEDYSVPELAVDPIWLQDTLQKLSTSSVAPTVLACARLYSQGMQLIVDRPEIAYPLFVAMIDTLAGGAMASEEPTADEKVKTKEPVYARARELGLSEEGARELAIVATKGMNWHGWKFRKLLATYAAEDIWEKEDDLFHLIPSTLPQRDSFLRALSEVISERGSVLHGGGAYPASVGVGTGPQMTAAASYEIMAGTSKLPPVTWFERVAQSAALGYITRKLGKTS